MRILLDVDGVIADFKAHWLAVAESALRFKPVEVDLSHWDMDVRCNLSPWQRLTVAKHLYTARVDPEPIDGAIEGVKHLLKDGHEVYFVTQSMVPHQTWDSDRRRWFDKWLDTDCSRRLVFCRCKHIVAGDLFVDDRPRNCHEWEDGNALGEAVLFGQTFVGGEGETWPGPRARNWPELLAHVTAVTQGRYPG